MEVLGEKSQPFQLKILRLAEVRFENHGKIKILEEKLKLRECTAKRLLLQEILKDETGKKVPQVEARRFRKEQGLREVGCW